LPANPDIKHINRVIDANLNRAKEGLRVCEEVTRFILEDKTLTKGLKKIRHGLDGSLEGLPCAKERLQNRRVNKDIGLKIYGNELRRRDIKDIFFANIQRAKESIRVLEEFTKLLNKKSAVKFKLFRYRLYELEQLAAKKISS
jgi:hypothetical protein